MIMIKNYLMKIVTMALCVTFVAAVPGEVKASGRVSAEETYAAPTPAPATRNQNGSYDDGYVVYEEEEEEEETNVSKVKSALEPADATRNDMSIHRCGSISKKKFRISFSMQDKFDQDERMGFEIELYRVKGNKKVKTFDVPRGDITSYIDLKKNTPYKYRGRFYVMKNGKKDYGKYSKYNYFWLHTIKAFTRTTSDSNKEKFIVEWSKVEGATKYLLYGSKRNSKFKVIAKAKKNARKLVVTKVNNKPLSSNNSYAVYFTAKLKGVKKVVDNDLANLYAT